MSLGDLGLIDYVSRTLLIDGDLIVFQSCCVFNEDDDQSRRMIIKTVNQKIERLMQAADCDKYIMFLTTKFNFRDFLVDDYKLNRSEEERPVNLKWAKRWATTTLNCHYHKMLEADDLLGIYMTDETVLWSLDKDLRQIPGDHLDDATGTVIEITNEGMLRVDTKVNSKGKKEDKVYFAGTVGLYYQMLIGDSTDYIVGCGKRVEAVRKSGKDKGQTYIKRAGVGPKTAVGIILTAVMSNSGNVLESALNAVILEYKKVHGSDWQKELETQANLLFMVRKQYGEVIQRWTYDGREEYFDLVEGVILDDYKPPTN
jgi:5'-3' exonuclease